MSAERLDEARKALARYEDRNSKPNPAHLAEALRGLIAIVEEVAEPAPDADWKRPSVFIQYKGTDICIDFHCLCDREDEGAGVGHFDGYFAYALKCARCGRVYEMPSELPLTLVESTRFEPRVIEPEWEGGGDAVPVL